MSFSNIAYAKLDLSFDREKFIQEFDNRIMAQSTPMGTGMFSVKATKKLNSVWNMVPDSEYETADSWEQPGDITTLRHIIRGRPVWQMFQLMALEVQEDDDPLVLKFAQHGGAPIRNETIGRDFKLKPGFEDLEIVKWINNVLPLDKVSFIHCVSMQPNCFSTIHRDGKGLFNKVSSAGVNRLYNAGYVIININITDGGVPLYWSLDHDVKTPLKATSDVYLTNDYFLHGVPICTSMRRQIRVTGIPKSELWDSFDKSSVIDLGKDYQFSSIENQYRFNL